MAKRLDRQVAIVTGGAGGIGRGVALRLAAEGASVVVADVNEKDAGRTAKDITASGGRSLVHPIDLRRMADIPGMIEHTVSEWHRLDILVNVAGVVRNQLFLDVSEADWDWVLDVNLKAAVFCMQSAARQMIDQIPESAIGMAERSFGKIVNIASISGRRGRALQIHYAASKAAIISVTQSAALALAPHNINVNAVSPGVVETAMWAQNVREKNRIFGSDAEKEAREFIKKIPLPRTGTPEDMAGAVVFLCSRDADYITGQTLNVDGGFEMD